MTNLYYKYICLKLKHYHHKKKLTDKETAKMLKYFRKKNEIEIEWRYKR